MKTLWVIIEGYGLTVGLASILQMIWYFYEITVLGLENTAVFEPDPVLRTVEFALAVTGFVALFLTACRVIGRQPEVVSLRKLTPKERLSLGLNIRKPKD